MERENGASAVLAAARAYTRRGWRVVPVRPGEKGVAIVRWQQMRLAEDDLHKWFGQIGGLTGQLHHNIGILTGEPSGGLVDVDCDAPEARAAAAELLPATGLLSGRMSNPASHYWYRITGELPVTTKFSDVVANRPSPPDPLSSKETGNHTPTTTAPGDVAAAGSGSPPASGEGPGERAVPHRGMLIELRSTGGQTLAPPSEHPSGEVVRWERDGEPGVVSGPELLRAVARVAAVALLARHWPGEGQRDEAAKDLAGLLVRGGWAEGAVDDFTRLVARIAGDEEWGRRGKAQGTARKLAEGGAVTGGRSLASRLTGVGVDGERVVALVRRWLELTGLGSAHADNPSAKLDQQTTKLVQPSQYHRLDKFGTVGHLWSAPYIAVEVTQVNWLWPGRIPLGGITLLDGDPGLGKSLITLDLAARVSTGREMPDGSPGLGSGAGVVLLSAEDDPSTTIAPRLLAAGANLALVEGVFGMKLSDPETGQKLPRPFFLPQDIPFLEELIERIGARLVVIDPLMAYLDMSVNSWRDQDVRATLAPLVAFAERMQVAVVILRHLTKALGGNALYRGGGSIGFIGASRAGLLAAKHPDNPDHERVLASTKSNFGSLMPSLRYRLATSASNPNVAYVDWRGECALNAMALLAAPALGRDETNPSKVEEAVEWLRVALADGPRPKDELEQAAQVAGIASRTLRRACDELDISKQKVGYGTGASSIWSLSTAASTDDGSNVSKTTKLVQPEIVDKLDKFDGQVWKDVTPCPVTGRPHEYAQMRDAKGRLLCVECGEPALSPSPSPAVGGEAEGDVRGDDGKGARR
jgi:AAA domain-containing protein/bifunctional DNA primase/polymerase-like protein